MLTGRFVPCETINGHYKQFMVSLKPFEILWPERKNFSMETFSVLFDKSAGPKWQLRPKSTRKFFSFFENFARDYATTLRRNHCQSIRSLRNFKV